VRYVWVGTGITLALAAFLTVPLGSASAAEAPGIAPAWQVVGQIGGPTQAVDVQGHYAYVGVGLRLVVLDVSDPAAPTEVGCTTPFPYFVEDTVVSGTLAYVAAGGAGLRVVDVSDPAHPTELGAWDSPGYAEGVAVSGAVAYLADGPYGLRAVEVADPAHPIPRGAAYDTNYAYEVALSGGYAYLAAAGAGLLVADVSDPAHPVEVGTLDTPGYAYGVAVSGTMACIADGWEALRMVNVSNPAHPVEVSGYDTPGWAFGVTVVGTRAYVADAFGGLRVLDVSDTNHPKELGGLSLWRGHAGSVAVNGNIAYVVDHTWGLRVMDISDPTHPAELGAYCPMGYAEAVAVEGSYAYVAAGEYGLRIVDLSDVSHPRESGGLAIPDPNDRYASAVAVKDGYAYVGIGGKLYVADVSDPTQPHWTEKIDQIGNPLDMTVAGNIAYVANEDGLLLIDLSDPAHPARLGSIGGGGNGVAVSGTLAYVTAATDGFHIVDVSDPSNPTRIGGSTAFVYPVDVFVVGNWAYVLDQSRVYVVDVSNPVQPQVVSYAETEGDAKRVIVNGTTAYVADGARGLSMVDVSDPFHPAFVANFNTPGYSLQVTLANDRLFIPDGSNGVVILQSSLTGDAIPTITKGPVGSLSFPGAVSPMDFTRLPVSQVVRTDSEVTFTLVVASPLDSGPGTLRQALLDTKAGDRITFDPTVFPAANPVTITLESDLPLITQGNLTIDGSDAGVILDGSQVPVASTWPYGWAQGGLRLCSDGNTIMGLQIVRFPGSGVLVEGDNNVIGGDRGHGRGPLGHGNLLSGNGIDGVYINGSQNNVVVGNLLGTDVTGSREFGNGYHGVGIGGPGRGNRIGGTDPQDRNIVSGNDTDGVEMFDSSGNFVIGNYIGTDISGSVRLGNHWAGIVVEVGSFNNVVQGNLSSGNRTFGVVICDWGSNYNVVVGNLIGTDASGTQAIPNGDGVIVALGPAFNRIGGTEPGEANLISGNHCLGVSLNGPIGPGNLVIGNLVGTDISGHIALGNVCSGIFVATSDAGTIVEGNLTSGNRDRGIALEGDYNFVMSNHIGSDINLTGPVPNGAAGIYVRGEHNLLQDNLAAYTLAGPGFDIERRPYNTIRRNSIYSNANQGICLFNGGNQMVPAPIITAVTATGASGTACPGCTVEVFSDDEDEGRVYEGTVAADSAGHWQLVTGNVLSGPFITATATDVEGNTSEFSLPVRLMTGWLYLPLLMR
jgi:hypothetical protein